MTGLKNLQKTISAISLICFFSIFTGFIFQESEEVSDPLKNLKLQTPITPFLGFTSSFGEFRTNHLHGGIDFSTGQKNGVPVLAVLDGEVREVKITYRGYGKVLYLNHKNNLTSVYAHLSKFHPQIEEYLKPFYEKSLYPGTVNIEPPIKFKAGDVIAYSGETGEGFPHLHYELRKDNNPVNPLPYFSFEKISKVEVNRIVITPESPYTSINGKFKKSIFNFPIKGEINIKGPFSLGVEARDFYNGNKRGIQEIELFLDGKPVSRVSPDILSFDYYYGVRFLYDGIFSRFSPIKMFYNLNKQEGNPFSFMQGERFFDPEEGVHNFEIVVKGAKDSIKKRFKINYKKPQQKPVFLNQTIFLKNHFFLPDIEGQFYPEEIKRFKAGGKEYYIGKLKPFEKFSLDRFEVIHQEKRDIPIVFYLGNINTSKTLPSESPCLYIEPKEIGFTKKMIIKVNLKDKEKKEQLGIYRIRGNLYLGGYWEGEYLRAEVFGPEDFVVLRDNLPPSILKVYKKYGKLYVIAKDTGSGIPWDGVRVSINGKEKILEYDPDHLTAQGEIMEKGRGIIILKDYAGNKVERYFYF